jgi:hypothetical protein
LLTNGGRWPFSVARQGAQSARICRSSPAPVGHPRAPGPDRQCIESCYGEMEACFLSKPRPGADDPRQKNYAVIRDRVFTQSLSKSIDADFRNICYPASFDQRQQAAQDSHHVLISLGSWSACDWSGSNHVRSGQTGMPKCCLQLSPHIQLGTAGGESLENPASRLHEQFGWGHLGNPGCPSSAPAGDTG